ncbi:MAG: hypothetical protein HW421_863 [Ignavibacteria bacterium]|nr:hypothetical protein [Ignavibacteria bacterium]
MSKPLVTADAKIPTDQDAHSSRIAAYANFAQKDIMEVLGSSLFELPQTLKLNILDLGCGTGKQSIWLAKRFPNSKILSLDASENGISILNSSGFSNITARCLNFDAPDFIDRIKEFSGEYDIINSFYAIYYAQNEFDLIVKLRELLIPGGKLILTGYSQFNNKELVEITNNLTQKNFKTDDFIEIHNLPSIFRHDDWKYFYFYNTLTFPDIGSFVSYYQNYGLYDKSIEVELTGIIQKLINSNGSFDLTKSALVVESVKASVGESAEFLPAGLVSDKFSSLKFRELLRKIKANKYCLLKFSGIFDTILNKTEPYLLIRHDIDNSIELALRMAEIEFEEGIKSSYFILLSGGFFNPLVPENRNILKRISELGHEIGIHYENPELFHEDIKVLEAIIGKPVESFSQHNPTIEGLKQIGNTNLINAYDRRITNELKFKYISDSGMKWRNEDSFDAIGSPRLYLLLHPEAWFSEGMDLIQQLRVIENNEIGKIKKIFNRYIDGNITYLLNRKKEDN